MGALADSCASLAVMLIGLYDRTKMVGNLVKGGCVKLWGIPGTP